MDRRRRSEYTYWENQHPVADPYELLSLLRSRQSGRYSDERHLHPHLTPPELHLKWHREGSSGGDTSGYDYYEVATEVATHVVRERWVEPHVHKFWGGSTVEKDKLVLSRFGLESLRKHIDTQEKEAKKLIVPGEHTKFSSVFNYREHGWHSQDGEATELCFEFTTPMDERIRVHLSSKRVVNLDKERA